MEQKLYAGNARRVARSARLGIPRSTPRARHLKVTGVSPSLWRCGQGRQRNVFWRCLNRDTNRKVSLIEKKSDLTMEERGILLGCRRLPARLNSAETAAVLGFSSHDIPVLVAARLLSPLGKPAQNAPKYFPARQVEEGGRDDKWLGRATAALAAHWADKNAKKAKPRQTAGISRVAAAEA